MFKFSTKWCFFLQKFSATIVTKAIQVMQRLCQSELVPSHQLSWYLLIATCVRKINTLHNDKSDVQTHSQKHKTVMENRNTNIEVPDLLSIYDLSTKCSRLQRQANIIIFTNKLRAYNINAHSMSFPTKYKPATLTLLVFIFDDTVKVENDKKWRWCMSFWKRSFLTSKEEKTGLTLHRTSRGNNLNAKL